MQILIASDLVPVKFPRLLAKIPTSQVDFLKWRYLWKKIPRSGYTDKHYSKQPRATTGTNWRNILTNKNPHFMIHIQSTIADIDKIVSRSNIHVSQRASIYSTNKVVNKTQYIISRKYARKKN